MVHGKFVKGQFFPAKRQTGIDKPGRRPQEHTIVLAEEDGFPPGVAVYYDPYAKGIQLRMRRFNRTDLGVGGVEGSDYKITGQRSIMNYIRNNWPDWGPNDHPEAPEDLSYYGKLGWYQAAAYPYVDLPNEEKMLRAIDIAQRHTQLRKDVDAGLKSDGSETWETVNADLALNDPMYQYFHGGVRPDTGTPGGLSSILGSQQSSVVTSLPSPSGFFDSPDFQTPVGSPNRQSPPFVGSESFPSPAGSTISEQILEQGRLGMSPVMASPMSVNPSHILSRELMYQNMMTGRFGTPQRVMQTTMVSPGGQASRNQEFEMRPYTTPGGSQAVAMRPVGSAYLRSEHELNVPTANDRNTAVTGVSPSFVAPDDPSIIAARQQARQASRARTHPRRGRHRGSYR